MINRRRKHFVRTHYEMLNLDEWISLVGDASSYPVTMDEITAATPTMIAQLAASARRANAAFAVRAP